MNKYTITCLILIIMLIMFGIYSIITPPKIEKETMNTTANITGLTSTTEYYYRAFTWNASNITAGNFSTRGRYFGTYADNITQDSVKLHMDGE